MTKLKVLVASVAMASTVAACSSGSSGPPGAVVGAGAGAIAGGAIGSQFGSGSGNIAAIAGGALLGAVLGGALGAAVEANDEAEASAAAQTALANGDGQPVQWNNPQTGNYGSFTATPAPSYGAGCQKAESIVYVNGQQQVNETYVRYNAQTQRYEPCA